MRAHAMQNNNNNNNNNNNKKSTIAWLFNSTLAATRYTR